MVFMLPKVGWVEYILTLAQAILFQQIVARGFVIWLLWSTEHPYRNSNYMLGRKIRGSDNRLPYEFRYGNQIARFLIGRPEIGFPLNQFLRSKELWVSAVLQIIDH